MEKEEVDKIVDETIGKKSIHKREKQPAQNLKIRNILNIIFMIGAIIGLLMYFYSDKFAGTIIILIAMSIKIAESIIRMINR